MKFFKQKACNDEFKPDSDIEQITKWKYKNEEFDSLEAAQEWKDKSCKKEQLKSLVFFNQTLSENLRCGYSGDIAVLIYDKYSEIKDIMESNGEFRFQ